MLDFRDPRGRTASEIAFTLAEALFGPDGDATKRTFTATDGSWQIGTGNDYWFYDLGEGNFRLIHRHESAASDARLRGILTTTIGVRVAD